jgi:4-hydroxybenzoate polyprenyltransferase
MLPATLRLIRPGNVVTAYADIVAGYAAAGIVDPPRLIGLLIATTGLYGGGIVLNDVFDAHLDAIERPERPLPRGQISRRAAALLGAALLVIGLVAAWTCTFLAGMIALAIALSVLVYDSLGKRSALFGPFNMGLCRGLNLLLGMSLQLHPWQIWIGSITLCYIAGVTVISRGEVPGGTRTAAIVSGAWLLVCVLVLSVLITGHLTGLPYAAPLLAFWLIRVVPAFLRAFRTLMPGDIRAAVKAGVLSLVILDATIAALYGGPWYGLVVLALYVPAILLAKLVAVT